MKIRVILPAVVPPRYYEETKREASRFKAPDTEIEVVGLDGGIDDLMGFYEETINSPYIVEKAVQAEKDRCDGIFVNCFVDPGVDASREAVTIPVVGAFQPAALTASLISNRWSIVTALEEVIPLIRNAARKLGIENNIVSIRHIDMTLEEMEDKVVLRERTLLQIEKAVDEDGSEAVALGCTLMKGVAQKLAQEMAEKGKSIPVIDPIATAIGYLEFILRTGVWKTFYRPSRRGKPWSPGTGIE